MNGLQSLVDPLAGVPLFEIGFQCPLDGQPRQYKNLKGLKKENLRDNMTTLELVLNMLAEATTTQFSKDRKPTTFQENLEVAKAGGQVAGRTRKDIESQSNTPVISPKNAAQLNQIVTDLLEGVAADMSEMPEEK